MSDGVDIWIGTDMPAVINPKLNMQALKWVLFVKIKMIYLYLLMYCSSCYCFQHFRVCHNVHVVNVAADEPQLDYTAYDVAQGVPHIAHSTPMDRETYMDDSFHVVEGKTMPSSPAG